MMVLQIAALGSKALTQSSAGTGDEVIAAWFVGVLLGGALLALVVVSAFKLVKRQRWRHDARSLLEVASKHLSDVDPS
jgi:hypothetical protein